MANGQVINATPPPTKFANRLCISLCFRSEKPDYHKILPFSIQFADSDHIQRLKKCINLYQEHNHPNAGPIHIKFPHRTAVDQNPIPRFGKPITNQFDRNRR